MAKVVHMSVASRYRLVMVLAAAVLMYAVSSSRFSISVPTLIHVRDSQHEDRRPQVPLEVLEDNFFSWENPEVPPRPKPPYKPPREPWPPVPDPFPLLSQNRPPKRSLLQAPRVNRPPKRHYAEQTPLLVGFTRNWPLLLQCVVSYIAAGWPPEDIYVVENTGVMLANRDGRLTLQNPFYLNHTQLAMLGVNVIITPTLLTFAQLQNFYLWTALSRSWPYFFWTHQDLLVFSHENTTTTTAAGPSSSLYAQAVQVLRHLTQPTSPRWAHHFFAYDHLTLVHRDAVLAVGAWDTHIPYYASDCDLYVRAMWAGYMQGEISNSSSHGDGVGIILDVGSVLADLGALLRVPGVRARRLLMLGGGGEEEEEEEEEDFGAGGGYREYAAWVDQHGETWQRLVELGYQMQADKYAGGESNAWRNSWQVRQRGGQGEPFYRDPEGFETGVRMMIDTGRSVFAEKWGHRGCDIARMGIKAEDAWRLERDWDENTEGLGFQGESW